jgi:hypothetical protein
MSNGADELDPDLARLRAHAEQLGEHFDTVQIFVTRHEHGQLEGTVNCAWGTGSYFTRSGQIREWIVKQDERARAEVRRKDGDA